jgi:GntR family transcriptional regulator
MQVEPNDPRPPYAQVADGLRQAIQSGELPAGTKLPAGRELATQWGVALMTVQKAIDRLRDAGLVVSHRGRGVFVASGNDSEQPDDLTALRQSVDELSRRLERVEEHLRTSRTEPS